MNCLAARNQRSVALIAAAIVSNRDRVIALKNAAIKGLAMCHNSPGPGPRAAFTASLEVRVYRNSSRLGRGYCRRQLDVIFNPVTTC